MTKLVNGIEYSDFNDLIKASGLTNKELHTIRFKNHPQRCRGNVFKKRSNKPPYRYKLKPMYAFPAIFDFASDGISIEYPDLPGCLSCAETLEKAVSNAKEVLELFLWGMKRDGEEIPEPTPVDMIKLKSNQKLSLIKVFIPSEL